SPEDAKGLKFRVQASDVLVAQFEQLGASPQKMSFKEVYGGLQTKVIDGQENTWSNIYGKKFFEVQDGVTETNHGIIDYLVVTSDEWWNGLDAGVRDQLATILAEVTETRNQEAFAVNQENKAKIVESGGEIRTLTPEQRQAWVDALKPVWKKFEGDIGADLINAAQATN
ncbi:MAG: TRAP transporter substrate-binding protein DctP, partial [Pseudomonadota bacterium]